MAAVVFGDAGPDWLQLAQHVKKELPSYAIPYFVRPMSAQDITGTFKHRKVELVKEGWSACGDAVFFYGERGCCSALPAVELTPCFRRRRHRSLQLRPSGRRPQAPHRAFSHKNLVTGGCYFHQKLTLKLGVNERT